MQVIGNVCIGIDF